MSEETKSEETNAELALLSKTIKHRCVDLNIKSGDLISKAGISPPVLFAINNGKGNPALKTITKILDQLGLEIQYVPKQ